MKHFEAGQGTHLVSITVELTGGNGICAFLTGGSMPHVGGVAVAVPRKKSSGEGLTCDISQICVPGHKDVYAAAEVAKIIALESGEVTSVTAGMHMDSASKDDIAQLMENARKATKAWLADKQKQSEKAEPLC